jgi:hypothetical protein
MVIRHESLFTRFALEFLHMKNTVIPLLSRHRILGFTSWTLDQNKSTFKVKDIFVDKIFGELGIPSQASIVSSIFISPFGNEVPSKARD